MLINASIPVGPTFIGEILILIGLININPIISLILLIALSINSVAHYFLINKIIGKNNIIMSIINYNNLKKKNLDLNFIEFVILFVLFYFIFRLFFFPNFYFFELQKDLIFIYNIIYNINICNNQTFSNIMHLNLDTFNYLNFNSNLMFYFKYKLLLLSLNFEILNNPENIFYLIKEINYFANNIFNLNFINNTFNYFINNNFEIFLFNNDINFSNFIFSKTNNLNFDYINNNKFYYNVINLDSTKNTIIQYSWNLLFYKNTSLYYNVDFLINKYFGNFYILYYYNLNLENVNYEYFSSDHLFFLHTSLDLKTLNFNYNSINNLNDINVNNFINLNYNIKK